MTGTKSLHQRFREMWPFINNPVAEAMIKFVQADTAALSSEKLVDALKEARKRMRNCRGAIESNQVVDKDVHGSLTSGMTEIDAVLALISE